MTNFVGWAVFITGLYVAFGYEGWILTEAILTGAFMLSGAILINKGK